MKEVEGMFKLGKNNTELAHKMEAEIQKEQELSEAELTKVAGGVPPRGGTAGMEI